jgi:FAD/FMN-containing dehydrogenase
MRQALTYFANATTFWQFSQERDTGEKSAVYKAFLASYLLLSHAALLGKKEWARQQMERTHAGMSYEEKVAKVQRDFNAIRPALEAGEQMSSTKAHTHQFAKTVIRPKYRLDSRFLNKALIDAKGCFIDIEANMSFRDAMTYAFQQGFRLPLVPEFLDITVGGAFVGVAVESSSQNSGLFHQQVLQVVVLMADGSLKTVSLKQDAKAFCALPNSNGTLGRVTRLRLPLIPLKSARPEQTCHPYLDPARQEAYLAAEEPAWLRENHLAAEMSRAVPSEHVHLQYLRFDSREEAYRVFWQHAKGEKAADFLESVELGPDKSVVIVGNVVEKPPEGVRAENYQTREVFYQQVVNEKHKESYVPLLDYYSRWHQTVFWNTQNLGPLTRLLNQPSFRKMFGRFMGPSFVAMLGGAHTIWQQHTRPEAAAAPPSDEHMVQDMGVPEEHELEFSRWYEKNIGLYPVWRCAVKPSDGRFPSFDPKNKGYLVDWGMFTGKGKPIHPSGDRWHYNKMIIQWLKEHGGLTALYSDNRHTKAQYDESYNGAAYRERKAVMDPKGVFPTVYEKMIASQQGEGRSRAPHETKLPFSFDSFMLWAQCSGVSILSSTVAAYCLSRPKLDMMAMGAALGVAAMQLSRSIAGLVARGDTATKGRVARGVSAWVSLGVVGTALTLMTRTQVSPLLLAATVLSASVTVSVTSSRVSDQRRSMAP